MCECECVCVCVCVHEVSNTLLQYNTIQYSTYSYESTDRPSLAVPSVYTHMTLYTVSSLYKNYIYTGSEIQTTEYNSVTQRP